MFSLTVLSYSNCAAQIAFDIENQTAVIDSVLSVTETPKDQLYDRAKEWMLRNLKSADEQVELNDDSKSSLIGTGNLLMPEERISYSLKVTDKYVNFKISIFFKDNRYRYIVENIVFNQTIVGEVKTDFQTLSIETIYNYNSEIDEMLAKKKKRRLETQKAINQKIIDSIEESLNALLHDLRRSMANKTISESDW